MSTLWSALAACLLPLTACSGNSESAGSPKAAGGAAGAAGSSSGGGGTAGSNPSPPSKYDYAHLLATGPIVEVRCDITPGNVRLAYIEFPGSCTELAATNGCSKVECDPPGSTLPKPAEPITLRTGSIELILPSGATSNWVVAPGVCGDTIEIEVGNLGSNKVTLGRGAPLTACSSSIVDPSGPSYADRYEAGAVLSMSSVTFGVRVTTTTNSGRALRGVCLGDAGDSALQIPVGAPETLDGYGPVIECFTGELKTILVGGKKAVVSSFATVSAKQVF